MDNIWYLFCVDTCKNNKDKQEELVSEINTSLKKIDEQSRVSCLSYNNKIFMHYDYNYKDIEYLDNESLIFRNETLPIYDLLGDIFLKIIENKTTYKSIICNIYTYKLNIREKIYTKTVIENLFNTINNKTSLTININLINQELITIKDIFNLDYTEPIEENYSKNRKTISKKNSETRTTGSSEHSGRKNIYFNIHIRN